MIEIHERNAGMTIRAVVFDIGGVLEITPQTGWVEKWEARLHLKAGELHERLMDVWRNGSIGTISEEEVEKGVKDILGIGQEQVEALMADSGKSILVSSMLVLAAYFSSLHPRYQTAILSNSFVGARQSREQERYHFDEMTDVIIYSHEVGIAKPERRIFELTCERLGVPADGDRLPGRLQAPRRCCPRVWHAGHSLQRNQRGHRRHPSLLASLITSYHTLFILAHHAVSMRHPHLVAHHVGLLTNNW